MKRFLIVFVMLLMCGGVSAQQEIKTKELPEFRRVNLTGKLIVKMVRDQTPRVDIALNQTEIKNLEWNVSDGVLNIRLRPGGATTGSADITLYYNKVDEMKISGANVLVEGVFDGEMLDVSLEAGAILGMEMDLLDFYLKVAGNSAANLKGSVKYYTLEAGARSKVDTRGLMAQDARVEAASAAEVYVCADERLQIKAATGASVYYRGEPVVLRTISRTMATINNIGK